MTESDDEPLDYQVPSTSMTLRIKRTSTSSIPQADITTCLQKTLAIAKQHPKDALLQVAFRHQEAHSSVMFAAAPSVWLPEITWLEMVNILSGLLDYFKETERCLETRFSIEDEDRGQFGSGGLYRVKPEPEALTHGGDLEEIKS